jgi:hypothetical protein
MTTKRFWRPFAIASLAASVGLLAAPVGPSVSWMASAATSAPPVLTVQTPTTLDSYLAYVEDLLTVQAMKMHTPAVADVKRCGKRKSSVWKTRRTSMSGSARC